MVKKRREKEGRKLVQWISIPLLGVVIGGGYYWPYLGFTAIILMISFMLLSIFRGRLYCGWACPMGSFHERVLSVFSLKKDIPSILKSAWFKWIVFVGLMGFLMYRLLNSDGHALAFASIFRMMWLIATVVAIGFGLIFKPRTWCAVCPMGTIQGIIGRDKYVLNVGHDCRQCGLCKQVCPIQTYPGEYKEQGYVDGGDCMRCFNCVVNCPKKAITVGDPVKDEATCSEMCPVPVEVEGRESERSVGDPLVWYDRDN